MPPKMLWLLFWPGDTPPAWAWTTTSEKVKEAEDLGATTFLVPPDALRVWRQMLDQKELVA